MEVVEGVVVEMEVKVEVEGEVEVKVEGEVQVGGSRGGGGSEKISKWISCIALPPK